MTGFPPYRERVADFAGLRRFGGWSVKVYTIDAGAETSIEASWEAAMERIPALLPPDPGAARAYGEAFAIVHAGEDAVWLLVHWWTDVCLLQHRLAAAHPSRPTDFDLSIQDTLVACSWELAVISYERDAWVRTIQSRGPDADLEAYRAAVMPRTSV